MILILDKDTRKQIIQFKDNPDAVRYILSKIYDVPLRQIPKILRITLRKNGDLEIIFSRSANLPLYKKIKSEPIRV